MHRLMAMAVTTCAAGLSVTACTAGITSTGPATAPSPASSRTASSPASAASHTTSAASSPVDTVNVGAPIGSFPIPHGAQLVANMANIPCAKAVLVELGSVTPAQASAFYTSALPRAGYKITGNTLASDPHTGAPQALAEIMFTGHGYTGLIIAIANLGAEASADPSMAGLPSNITKNAVEISLTPPGASGCPTA
jgi:hypothetical protein